MPTVPNLIDPIRVHAKESKSNSSIDEIERAKVTFNKKKLYINTKFNEEDDKSEESSGVLKLGNNGFS